MLSLANEFPDWDIIFVVGTNFANPNRLQVD